MSVLERCPSYRKSKKGSKERQGPTLSVCFTEVSVLERCPLRESRLYFHAALEFEQSCLTQFNFKAGLNREKSFISKPSSCLVLLSVQNFILGGLWFHIKANTILFTL